MSDYDKLNLWYKQQADSGCCTLIIMMFFAPIILVLLFAYLAHLGCFK